MPDQTKTPDIRAMIEAASATAGKLFAEDQCMAPMWCTITAGHEIEIFIPPPGFDKDTAISLMRTLFKVLDIVSCVFMDEAWTTEASEDGIKKLDAWLATGKSLESYPGRKEVVVFMAEDDSGRTMTGHRLIDRSGDKPSLGPLVINDMTGATIEGRLTGMLSRRDETVH